jgi:hypothetical protein
LEAKKKALKLLKITLALIIVIGVISIGSYIYFAFLKPKPGPPMFRYEGTATLTDPNAGTVFSFDYTPVSGGIKTAIFVINVTRVDSPGTLEIRVRGASIAYFRNIVEPGPRQANFDPRTVLHEGNNNVSIVNWGFVGSIQFIVYITTQ